MKVHKLPDGAIGIQLEAGDLPDEAYTHKIGVGKRVVESTRGKVVIEISAGAVDVLGQHGRMISASKSAYSDEHPDHEVYFNGCLFNERDEEIWFGDVDLTLERARLEQLAKRIGPFYLTPEHPYRFDGFDRERAGRDERVVHFPP